MLLQVLLTALPNVMHIVLLIVMSLLLFGLLFTRMFAGSESFCNDASVLLQSQCVGVFVAPGGAGYVVPRVWRAHSDALFSNLLQSVMTLFQAGSFQGWLTPLYTMMDATGPGLQPMANARPATAILLVLFLAVQSLFLVQLFVARSARRSHGTARHPSGVVITSAP